MSSKILIVTIENDIHALAVAHELRKKKLADPYILAADRLSSHYRINWTMSQEYPSEIVLPDCEEAVQLRDIDLVWWRRMPGAQKLDLDYKEEYIDLINNDWRGSLRGALETMHHGAWVSYPSATERASNKLIQLQAANRCGFYVPDTIISNDPVKVRGFIKNHSGRVIVKPVVGTKHSLLFTQPVSQERLDDESIVSVPAIYQEMIPGNRHLRINCFGDDMFAFEIQTDDLDWRSNLNVPIKPVEIETTIENRIKATLNRLSLAMGVIDLKIKPDGETVWFEVNPQGQFLFLEGITGVPLLREFCNYLSKAARNWHGKF